MTRPTPDRTDVVQRDPYRLILFGILSGLTAVLLVWLLYTVLSTLILVYISGMFAIGLSPLVRAIERQRVIPIGTRLPRWVAILIIYATVIGALVIVGMLIVPPLVDQAEDLWRSLPDKLTQAQQTLVRIGVLRRPITLGEAVQQAPAAGGVNAATTVIGAVKNVVGGAFGVLTLLLLTFYMLVESNGLFSFFVRLFPAHQRARVADVSAAVTTKVSAWLGGQLLLSSIIGVTSAIGLGIMGVPYFYVLALISAIGEMIPMIGPIVSAIPAILVAATVSPGLAVGVAVFFLVQQQLENSVLVPKIMGRQVGLSAVTVIVALGMGTDLLGVIGAILSVPTAAIVQVLVEELMARGD